MPRSFTQDASLRISGLLRRLHPALALLVTFILVCPPPLLIAANATAPDWWAEQQMIAAGKVADDFAGINQGQLKYMATKAAQAMEARLPGGAGAEVRALVDSWKNPPPATNDFQAINLGQLKFVAQPFYARLIALGLADTYPWANPAQPADDFALANLGQAKFLFSFPLPALSSTSEAPFRLDFTRTGLAYWQITPGTIRPSLGEAASGDIPLADAIAGTKVLTLAGQGGLAAFPVTLPNRLNADYRLSCAVHWDGQLANPGYSAADLEAKLLCQFNGIKIALGNLESPTTVQLFVWHAAFSRWVSAGISLEKNHWTQISLRFNPLSQRYSIGNLQETLLNDLTFIPSGNPFLTFHTIAGTQLQVTDLGLDLVKPAPDPATIPFAETFDGFWPGEPLRNGFHDWEVELTRSSAVIVPDVTTGSGRSLALIRPAADFPLPPVIARRLFSPQTHGTWTSLELRVKGVCESDSTADPAVFLRYHGIELGWADSGLSVRSGVTWQRVAASPGQFHFHDDEGWRHLRLEIDDTASCYDLYLDGTLVAARFRFLPAASTYLELQADFPGEVCFDDIYLTERPETNEPTADFTTDSDGDGIPDYWERVLGGNPYVADAHTDPGATGHSLGDRYALMQSGGADPVTGITFAVVGAPTGSGETPGGTESGNGGPTNPGYAQKKDSDKDNFTDYQESYFGYNKDNAADHPPTPRYVVIDLGADKTPKYISEQNGWIVCGNGQRWHQGQWQQLVPARISQRAPNSGEAFIPAGELGICDIGNDGTVVCDGLIVSQSGMAADALTSGVYWNTAGGIAEVPRTTNSQYGAHRWIQKLLENGKTISHLAHAGDSGTLYSDGFHHYNFGRHYLDQCDFLTGQVGETNQEPWRYTPTWINRAGGLLFNDQPTAGQSLVMASGNYPPSVSGLPANSWSYSAGLRSINHSGMGAGHRGGYPVYTLLEKKPGGNAGEGKVCSLPLRPGLPVEPALWINKQTGTDTAFMITSQSQVWLPKATGSTTDARFDPPVQLAALVDWNCGWADKWNITGINDAGYLIGTGYKIKSGQEAKTTGGEHVIDPKQYAESNLESHGFLMLPKGDVYTFSHNLVDSGTSKKRVFIEDNNEPVFRKKTERATELKVAQWFEPIRGYDRETKKIDFNEDEFLDPDAFFFRIKAPPPPAGQKHQVKVWTSDCPSNMYNDFGGEVDLHPVGNDIYQSKPIYLVGDRRDAFEPLDVFMEDTGQKDAQGQSIKVLQRRAFFVQLGGKVKFRFLGFGRANTNEPDRELLVPVKKVVKINPVVFNQGYKSDVEFLLERARERFAQCGIRLIGEVQVSPPSAGVNIDPLNLGLPLNPPDDKYTLGPDFTRFLDSFTKFPKVIPVFYLDYILREGGTAGGEGRAVIPAYLSEAYQPYANKILLNRDALSLAIITSQSYATYALGHELLHVLLNGGHPSSIERVDLPSIKYSEEFINKLHSLWSYGLTLAPDIYDTKRISDEMRFEILKSPFCQEP